MQKIFLISILSFCFFFQQISKSEIINGKAVIIDGDTIKINDTKIRLFGIDAPENKQLCKKKFLSVLFFTLQKKYSCGKTSTIKLKKLVGTKTVRCYLEGEDRYKRKIGICYKNKININSWLVRNGLAVAYIKYSKRFVEDEIKAKKDNIGLWQGEFEMPWQWRKKNR